MVPNALYAPAATPARTVTRVVRVESFDIPSVPLADARDRFLRELRWQTSRVTRRRIAESTVIKYRDWLRRFEHWLVNNQLPLDLGMVDDDAIDLLQTSILEEIDDGDLRESSANTYVCCIKAFFTHTWEALGLEPSTNPTLRMHPGPQTVPDFPLLSPEHVRALMAATVRDRGPLVPGWIRYRDRLLLASFLDLGWRSNEASAASLDDIDLRGHYVTIRKENVKVFRGRVVGLNPELARLMKAWIQEWRPAVPHLYVFVNDEGQRLAPRAMRQIFRRLAEAAGIPRELARTSPHTCRHYFAVRWARSHPGDIAGLQRVLGHASYRSTQRYIERADDIGAADRHRELPPNWR